MNSIASLYAYMLRISDLMKTFSKLSEERFINDRDAIAAYFAIYKDLLNYITNLDSRFMVVDKLNVLVKEIYEADVFMMDSYKLVNSYMLYDFFKTDYKELFNIVSELVK